MPSSTRSSRRSFLRTAAVTAAGVMVEACGATALPHAPDRLGPGFPGATSVPSAGAGHTSLRLVVQIDYVDVLDHEHLAGRYQYRDPYKPYLHPLNTPDGHTLSLAIPHDHKHHKGLMYALRARDVNFWEEEATLPTEVPGIERHERFDRIVAAGEQVGFDETLTWLARDGGLETFVEHRSITCGRATNGRGYVWSWSTQLEAQRDVELIMSQWSWQKRDGLRVNYHGLGIRFRRDFGCTGGNELRLDGNKVDFSDGLGQRANEAVFIGSLDGQYPARRAGVSLHQTQRQALFVIAEPFAYMGFGPTNLAPLALKKGARLEEEYIVTVFDDPQAAG